MGAVRAPLRCSCVLVLALFHTCAQVLPVVHGTQGCSKQFKDGRRDFMLNTEASVEDGATYISNPTVNTSADCARACCTHGQCNLALIQEQTDGISCFLFDCLYRNKFICSFTKKPGFNSYILQEVFQRYLASPDSVEDRRPIANAGADLVIRAGEPATLNGIESWDDKKITTYDWTLLKGNSDVVIEETEFSDQRVLSKLRPGVYKFQLTVTDSAGQSDSTSVTVLVLTPDQAERHCLTPKKVGPCRGSFTRWHFNAASGACGVFTFGGCKPNSNNYISKPECEDACEGTQVPYEVRKVKENAEVCGSQCEEGQFVCSSGCCVDKSLECDGEKHCTDGSDEENCNRLNMTLSQLLEFHVDEKKELCVEPPVTGPCRASMVRWFYDPLKQSCFRFTYGGCAGNANNFEKKDDCLSSCKDVSESDVFARGLFERAEVEGEPHTGSVAAGVIIALLLLALICLVGCFFLKTRKKKLQSQSAAPPTDANPAVPLTEDSRTLI